MMPRPLRQLGPEIWVADRPQSFYGLVVGTRMTVIRLDDGSLLLHSPVKLDPGLRKELDALGPVRYVVAPNRVHHLYAGKVADAYPDSRLWIGPGLETKRRDLVYEAILGDEAPAPWRGQVDQVFFAGRPYENEMTFFHRASRTLILCDLAFNLNEVQQRRQSDVLAAMARIVRFPLIRFGWPTVEEWITKGGADFRESCS